MTTQPQIKLDKEGYLVDLEQWDESVAHRLAETESLTLDERHCQVITVLREFYAATEISPAMRPLIKLVRDKIGQQAGSSIYLMTLFGGSPAKTAAKVAGLPRPTNCL